MISTHHSQMNLATRRSSEGYRPRAEKMNLDVETNYAEMVIDVGKAIFGDRQRMEVSSPQQKIQEIISKAVCALLNSGGGMVKAELENEDYKREIYEVGQDMPLVFRNYLDEMYRGNLFLIFVSSWNVEVSGVRLATLCSNLYQRCGTSIDVMDPQEALVFLKERAQAPVNVHDFNVLGRQEARFHEEHEANIKALADALFDRVQLQYLEKLTFPESMHVEFQMFPADLSQFVKERLPMYVSAFANTEGGYVFIGVHDETYQVVGCEKEKINANTLKDSIKASLRKLPVYHFCKGSHKVQYVIRLLEVHDKGTLCGYVCAIKVEPFCCAAFAKMPGSWQVKDNQVRQLTSKEWVTWMMETKPDLSRFPEMVLLQSVSISTPQARAVCTHKNLEDLKGLQRRYFPVSSGKIEYKPQHVYRELVSQHPGLRDLINAKMRSVSEGILIFSQSWAVDLGLHRKQGVICEALLISPNNKPVLYTVFNSKDEGFKSYAMQVARTLKQKLVNTGGYTWRLCIIPSVLLLKPDKTVQTLHGSEAQIYPESYNLTTTLHMEALLQSLVIVLLGFKSFLSEELGSEIWSLLTDEQYELLLKNLYKSRELFIYGLPGSGKTTLALRTIEKIENVFCCQPGDILYICENLPLRKFVSKKTNCQAVTRKTFMKNNFERIQHIIIDEAQNFHTEDGDWYRKAKAITQRANHPSGTLWIFLDYFQTYHLNCFGLPTLFFQNPNETLTRAIRNADEISYYLQSEMLEILDTPPPNIPPGALIMTHNPRWAQGIPGKVEVTEFPNLEEMVIYIADKSQFLWRNGYRPRDIAVLFSKGNELEKHKDKLLLAMRKRRMSQLNEDFDLITIRDAMDIQTDHIVLDSIPRFSGLERNIVFGIIPWEVQPAIFHNILFCLASRAKTQLYLLKVPLRQEDVSPQQGRLSL